MATEPLVILDDTSSNFQYADGQWHASKSPYFYGGTALSLTGGPGTLTGNDTFNVHFEGVAIALYGTSPSPLSSESISVSVDGGPSITTTFFGQISPAYRQLYQSPSLSDGRHSVSVGLSVGASLDFAAVTASPHTSLQGQKLVVDDDYIGIKYLGGWRRSIKDAVSNVNPGSPFHNGTHQTWNAGDSLSFTFTGTSVAVYGMFDWTNLGSLAATFTLDGSPKSDLYTVNASSPEFVNGVGQILNFPFFSSGAVASGRHTLLVNITHCDNQSFILDYITYTPSFDTISQLPNYTAISTTTSLVDPVRTDRYAGPTGTSVSDQGKKAPRSPSAIIGGCIGGLFFIALGCTLLYLLRRRTIMNVRRISEHDVFEDPSRPLMQNSLPRNIPLRPPSSTSHRSVSPYPYFTPITPRRPTSADELKQFAQEQRRSRRMLNIQQSSITNVAITDSHSSRLPSAETFSIPSHIPDSSGFSSRRPTNDLDDSGSQRALHTITQSPVINNSSNRMTIPHPERRARSATDPYRGSQQSPSPLAIHRLTPIRRGFSEPQPSAGTLTTFQVDDNTSRSSPTLLRTLFDPQDERLLSHIRLTNLTTPTRHTNPPSTHSVASTNRFQSSPCPNSASDPVSRLRSEESLTRLSPLRRQIQFDDPLPSAPQATTTSRWSPIAAAFPRLSTIFIRHQQPSLSHNGSEEGGENDTDTTWDGLSLAPPAYSPRRIPDGNAVQSGSPRSRPLPVPQFDHT